MAWAHCERETIEEAGLGIDYILEAIFELQCAAEV